MAKLVDYQVLTTYTYWPYVDTSREWSEDTFGTDPFAPEMTQDKAACNDYSVTGILKF
ncbi:MAG: hypothetical protein AAB425_05805 [Bdellovibrionota bacterium]